MIDLPNCSGITLESLVVMEQEETRSSVHQNQTIPITLALSIAECVLNAAISNQIKFLNECLELLWDQARSERPSQVHFAALEHQTIYT